MRVKRRLAVATGCSARLSWHFQQHDPVDIQSGAGWWHLASFTSMAGCIVFYDRFECRALLMPTHIGVVVAMALDTRFRYR